MKCKMCGKKTDWDSSFGRPNFLVCSDCVEELHNSCDIRRIDVENMILYIGFKRERRGKQNGK